MNSPLSSSKGKMPIEMFNFFSALESGPSKLICAKLSPLIFKVPAPLWLVKFAKGPVLFSLRLSNNGCPCVLFLVKLVLKISSAASN